VNEISISRQNLAYWIRNIHKGIELVVSICGFASFVFDETVLLDSITKMLLCWMDVFVSNPHYLQIDEGFDQTKLLSCIINICALLKEDLALVDRFVSNRMFDALNLVKKLFPIGQSVRLSSINLSGFEEFMSVVEQRKAAFDAEDMDFDDAPAEFFDELTAEIMTVPMRLPSGHVLDRECLERSLLADHRDPFTTTELKMEDCVLDVELKKRIEEYRVAKRQKRS
jgi:hypothetical protein